MGKEAETASQSQMKEGRRDKRDEVKETPGLQGKPVSGVRARSFRQRNLYVSILLLFFP